MAKNIDAIKIGEKLKAELSKGAYNVLNFEAPIEGVGSKITKSGPSLCQSKYSPSFVEKMGFNVVSMANNHAMDYGEEGCESTISLFSEKVIVVGAGRLENAYKMMVLEGLGGVKIGFLAVTHNEFGVLGTCANKEDYGTAWLNHPIAYQTIIRAKEDVDYLIILPHAGIEYMDAPLPEIRALYKNYVDMGADAVVASHPHQIQGWELHEGKPIFYSLGNFYFDMISGKNEKWYQSLMVSLFLDSETKNVRYVVKGVSFNTLGNLDIDETNAVVDRGYGLCSMLKSEQYLTYVDNFCRVAYPLYKYQCLRGLSGVNLMMHPKYLIRSIFNLIRRSPDEATLLNDIRCESHRWLLERIIKNIRQF